MEDRSLFQLGMDLNPGATQTEDTMNDTGSAAPGREESIANAHFVCRDGAVFAGTHLIIEMTGAEGLDDEARIRDAFIRAIDAAGATLLHIHLHRFSPQGVSGVAVLAESHISVHTWPEHGYGAFDVFMCGEADPWKAAEVLKEAFAAEQAEVRELRRGEGVFDERR